MERFCDKCGSLVSGDGKFCPLCGAKMGFELNISSDLDVDTSSSFLDDLDTSLPEIGDTNDTDKSASGTAAPQPAVGAQNVYNTNLSAQRHVPQGYVPQYMPQSQPYMQPPQPDVEKLTTGQWLGTIFLSTCLGIISYILLILWGFGQDTKEPRKSFARAMLLILPMLHLIMFIGVGVLVFIVNDM